MADVDRCIEAYDHGRSQPRRHRVFMMDEKGSRDKKNYEPPKVTVISLRPEEAVLGHCKNATTGGPGGGGCTHVGNCMTLGS